MNSILRLSRFPKRKKNLGPRVSSLENVYNDNSMLQHFTTKLVRTTLFLAFFATQMLIYQRSSEKPSWKFQKVPKKALEKKSPDSKVTGYACNLLKTNSFTDIFHKNVPYQFDF